MSDLEVERDLLVNQRRSSHLRWAFFFLVATVVLGFSSMLPGVQFSEYLMLSVYPGLGAPSAEWISSVFTIVCLLLGLVSTYSACRDTPTLQKLQSTDKPEDAYRASLLGLGLRGSRAGGVGYDRSLRGVVPSSASSRGSGGFNDSSSPSQRSSTSSPSSAYDRHSTNQQSSNTPGSGSSRRRASSRGRQANLRSSGGLLRGGSGGVGSAQSPISRLLSGVNGVQQWSSDRAREVASMSPVGRGLDVDLLDRRTGIDNPEMLSRYLKSFHQEREVEQQRSGSRTALDPHAQNGMNNRALSVWRNSSERKRDSQSSRTTSNLLGDDQLKEQDAKSEKEYDRLGISDYIVQWQSNFRLVFARLLKKTFLVPYDINNKDLLERGLNRGLLEHTELYQIFFSNMRDNLKKRATDFHTERMTLITSPDNHTAPQVKQQQEREAERLHGRLLDRLDSDFKDFHNLDLRQFLYRCSIQIKAHNRHREEQNQGRGGGGAGGGGAGGGNSRPGGGAGGGLGGSAFVPGAGTGHSLVPITTPGMARGANGILAPTANMFQSATVTADYERLFYCFFLSQRRDPVSNRQLVNIIEERERLEKYLLVPRAPNDSRGYVLKRIRELTRDRRFGEYNWEGGGFYKKAMWTPVSKLPSDVEIVLHLFFTHVESYLRVKGFAAKYKLSGDDLEQRHSVGPDLCIIEIRRTKAQPSHVQVFHKKRLLPVRSGRDNVFEAMALFLYFVHDMYQGILEGVDVYKELCLDEVFDDSRGFGGLMST